MDELKTKIAAFLKDVKPGTKEREALDQFLAPSRAAFAKVEDEARGAFREAWLERDKELRAG